jgi:hypothetical protein
MKCPYLNKVGHFYLINPNIQIASETKTKAIDLQMVQRISYPLNYEETALINSRIVLARDITPHIKSEMVTHVT